jgi:hypothetical protein
MVGVFKMETHPTFDVISPTPKADKPYFVFEGLLQGGI